jgi:hypothetical protein
MKRWIISAVLLFCLAAFLPADTAEEARALEKMNGAMNLFADRMEALAGPQDFIEAVTGISAALEEDGKAMVAVYRENPEWAEEPPAEIKPVLEKNRAALTRYDQALNAAARYANDHPEHEGCQEAMKRLATAAYEMYR